MHILQVYIYKLFVYKIATKYIYINLVSYVIAKRK